MGGTSGDSKGYIDEVKFESSKVVGRWNFAFYIYWDLDLPEPYLRTDLRSGDIGALTRLHGLLYAREYG